MNVTTSLMNENKKYDGFEGMNLASTRFFYESSRFFLFFQRDSRSSDDDGSSGGMNLAVESPIEGRISGHPSPTVT